MHFFVIVFLWRLFLEVQQAGLKAERAALSNVLRVHLVFRFPPGFSARVHSRGRVNRCNRRTWRRDWLKAKGITFHCEIKLKKPDLLELVFKKRFSSFFSFYDRMRRLGSFGPLIIATAVVSVPPRPPLQASAASTMTELFPTAIRQRDIMGVDVSAGASLTPISFSHGHRSSSTHTHDSSLGTAVELWLALESNTTRTNTHAVFWPKADSFFKELLKA